MNKILKPFLNANMLAIGIYACNPTFAGNSLCNKVEAVHFSCQFKSLKYASICRPLDAAADYLEYRFGTQSKIEMSYRSDKTKHNSAFHRGEVAYVNNSDQVLWFKNKGYVYRIYSPIKGVLGLIVSRKGAHIARLECINHRNSIIGDLDFKSHYVREHGPGGRLDFESLWSTP